MKKTLLSALAFCCFGALQAQDYVPLQLTGYNADVIANGAGSALLSTTNTVDTNEFVLLSSDYQLLAGDPFYDFALNPSGVITNLATPGLNYQLASFSGDNSMRLEFQSDMGQFTVGNPVSATHIYVLASCGNGAGTLGGTIHFSDNSTQAITEGVIPDWFFSNALPVVASGFGRIGRSSDLVENPTENPRFYQYQIAILPENQTKTIASIDFTKVSETEAVINIFAVSAKELGTCPPPNDLAAANVTFNSAIATWNAPAIIPSSGYQYYLSTSMTTPLPTTVPTGSTGAGVITVNITGLTPGTQYCLWLRSNCGDMPGPWGDPVCFTTGQVSETYPDNIPTLYADFVDVTSTTSCPGTMSVTVPDGFVISSVDTAYDMVTASNGWMSEQRSILVCTTNGTAEAAITSGEGGMTGTYHYERNGLDIADGLAGTVNFELRTWRTYGGADCNTTWNSVAQNSWTVTVTYEIAPLKTADFDAASFAIFPNPTRDVVTISGKEAIADIKAFNMLGQQVLQQNGFNNKEVQLSTAQLSSGKYLLKITSQNGVATRSILKN